jgi:hypothetical protein
VPFVDGPAILAQAGVAAPTANDTAWATICASAVDAAIATRLGTFVVAVGSAAEAELTRAALMDGVGAYADRDAPHGVLSLGPDGQTVRLGSDVLRASIPVIHRYVMPGIG